MNAAEFYKSGHFQRAAQLFLESTTKTPEVATSLSSSLDDVGECPTTRKRPRSTGSFSSYLSTAYDGESLQNLAAFADAALCLVRAMKVTEQRKTGSKKEFYTLCEQAMESHQRYCQELGKRITWMKTNNLFFTDMTNESKQKCAASYLNSVIAMSWLYVQMEKVEMSEHILLKGIKWAVSIVSCVAALDQQFDTAVERMTCHELFSTLQKDMSHQSRVVSAVVHTWNVLTLTQKRNKKPTSLANANHKGEELHKISGNDHNIEWTMRSQLVTALYYHLQIVNDPTSTSTLRKLRDDLLRKLDALDFVNENESTTLTAATKQLTRRFNLMVQATERVQEGTENQMHDTHLVDAGSLAHELGGLLGRSPSFAPTYNLLGCLRMTERHNESLALHDFEVALRGLDQSCNNPLLQVITSNITECFLQMGEPRQAVRLLLHLLKDNDMVNKSAHNCRDTVLVMSERTSFQQITKECLLWRLFQAASLCGDDIIALAAAEELHALSVAYSDMAYVFAVLQADRPSLALRLCENTGGCPLEAVALRLYKVDAYLLQIQVEQPQAACKLVPTSEKTSLSTINALADDALNLYLQLNLELTTVERKGTDSMIRATLYNNKGIIHLMEGEHEEALELFRRACSILLSASSQRFAPCLQPFFNLSCLLWKNRSAKEATQTWLPIRGIAFDSKTLDASVLLASFTSSFGRFKIGDKDPTRTSHISKWRPHHLDSKMAAIMDSILVQCGMEFADNATATKCIQKQFK